MKKLAILMVTLFLGMAVAQQAYAGTEYKSYSVKANWVNGYATVVVKLDHPDFLGVASPLVSSWYLSGKTLTVTLSQQVWGMEIDGFQVGFRNGYYSIYVE